MNSVHEPKIDLKLVTFWVQKAAKVNLLDEEAVITLPLACLFIGLF